MDRLNEIKTALDRLDLEHARELLCQELKDNPSAEVYYVAALAALDEEQRQIFLKKALEIDPFHEAARRALSNGQFAKPARVIVGAAQPPMQMGMGNPQSVMSVVSGPDIYSQPYLRYSSPLASTPIVTTKPKAKGHPLYILTVIGGLMLIIAAFLPWITLQLRNSTTLQELSITGMGQAIGRESILVKPLYETSLADVNGGTLALLLGVWLIVIAGVTIFTSHKAITAASIIFSLLACAGLALQYSEMNTMASQFVTVSVSSGSNSGGVARGLVGGVGSAMVGVGIYIGLIGAGLATLGSILAASIKRQP